MNYSKRIVHLLACLLLCAFSTSAQKDTEFWFAVPDISAATPYNADRPISLHITTYGQAATIVVSRPATNTVLQSFSLAANSTQSIDMTPWIDVLETKPADQVLDFGLKIVSDNPISAYYEVVSGFNNSYQNNPETYTLKGKNALGSDFWIPGQNLINNNAIYTPLPGNSFDIIATEDNTEVRITPAKNVVGHPAVNGMYIKNLNKGQVYSASATSQLAAQHLQGSRVTSNRPIAITVKDDLLSGVYGTCSDMAGDQIVPTDKIGTKYIATNGFLSNPNSQLFILGTQNGTTITKDGVAAGTVNEGQTLQLSIVNPSTYIEASNPIYVWQLSGIGCELGGTILPTIDCSGSDTVAYIRSTNLELWVNLVVPTGGESGFEINGNVINASQFAFVPGTANQWLTARISLPLAQYPQNQVVKVVNSLAKFHMGVLDGGSITGTSYGYFSDYGGISINAIASPNPACVGSNIQLQANSITGATYAWIGPNGFLSSAQNPGIVNANFINSGTYTVTVNGNGCSSSSSVNVSVINCPKECIIEVGYSVNTNNPYTFNFYTNTNPSTGSFTWNFGDGSGNFTTSIGNIGHTYPGPGSYTVNVTFTTPSGQKCSKQFNICIAPKEGSGQGTGINEKGTSDITEQTIGEIYPNPANTLINIPVTSTSDDALYTITLFNIEGKVIQRYNSLKAKSNLITLPVKQLVKGMYLCEISTPLQKVTRKFVKL